MMHIKSKMNTATKCLRTQTKTPISLIHRRVYLSDIKSKNFLYIIIMGITLTIEIV